MNFFKTKEGKDALICFFIYFITGLVCGANIPQSFIASVTAVIFIIPLVILFGAFLEMFNVDLKNRSWKNDMEIVIVIEWVLIIIHATSLPKEPHNQQQASYNYNSYNEQNYIPPINSQSIYQPQPIFETTKRINGVTYNIVKISASESIYSTSPTFDSNGSVVKVIYPETKKIITIAITSTNCSVFTKRLNNKSTLNPQIYVDGQLKDIFIDRGGIAMAKYICNYNKEKSLKD